VLRYLLHRALLHRVSIPGSGYEHFYRCRTCAVGWGHRCTAWCDCSLL
jgi:hypothetical protein